MMELEDRQLSLALLHYYNLRYQQPPRKGDLAIDRLNGPSMKSAIMAFQKAEGITADGLWGPETEKTVLDAIYHGRVKKLPAAPTISPKDIEKAIWDALAKKFPPASCAGIMGNLCAESALKPNNMEDQYQGKLGFNDQSYTEAVDNGSYTNFAHDAVGYGLAQWTWPPRKQALLDLARAENRSIADPTIQIKHLLNELHGQYSGLEKRLLNKNISVYQATEIFMRDFENPKIQDLDTISDRNTLSQKYYNRYGGGHY